MEKGRYGRDIYLISSQIRVVEDESEMVLFSGFALFVFDDGSHVRAFSTRPLRLRLLAKDAGRDTRSCLHQPGYIVMSLPVLLTLISSERLSP